MSLISCREYSISAFLTHPEPDISFRLGQRINSVRYLAREVPTHHVASEDVRC